MGRWTNTRLVVPLHLQTYEDDSAGQPRQGSIYATWEGALLESTRRNHLKGKELQILSTSKERAAYTQKHVEHISERRAYSNTFFWPPTRSESMKT